MAAPPTKAQLATRMDAQLRGIRCVTRHYIELLLETPYRASSAETVSCEIEILLSLADLAEGGLSMRSAKKKLAILKCMNKAGSAWIKAGLSEEFARAIKLNIWTRTKMPSTALN